MAVATICFVFGFAGRGLIESFVVFLLPISLELGLDRGSTVSIYALSVLLAGIGGPLVGRLFDRTGPRTVYAVGLALLGLGLSVAAFATKLWHLQLCLGVAVGLGAACLGNVSNAALLGRWFHARLAFVTSIVFSSFGIGMLVMIPVAQMTIERLGWRDAYHWMGGVTLALLIPMALLPWRELAAGHPELARRQPGSDLRSWTLAVVIREPAFWGIFSVYFFTSVAMFAIIVQVVAYLVAVGFPPLQAAAAWGFSGMLLPAGMILIGWLDGLIGRRPSVLLSYAVSLLGIGALWLLARFPNVWLLGFFVVCFGGMLGSRGPLLSTITLSVFRGPHAATIFGMTTVGNGLGAALGAWLGGLLHDWTGSYEPVIAFAAANVVCAIVPFFAVRVLR